METSKTSSLAGASASAIVVTVVLIALGGGTTARADQLTIGASKDNTLYENATGSLSNGAGNAFFAGQNDNGLIRRGVIAFDVSSIPTGSTVSSVTLTLYMSRTRTQTEVVGLYRALANWGEGTSHAAGEEGGGAPATTGDATWLHRFYPSTLWASPGGDFSATASATTSVGNTNLYSWSSAGMVADVQGWVDGQASNFGWVIRGDEVDVKSAKRFESRQSTTSTQRPVLTVVFTPGGAATGACCFANGSCSVLTQTNCTTQGGAYQGDGTSCTPNLCPQPTGACCLAGDTCQVLTQTQCTGQSGVYQGDGTSCTPDPCTTEPVTVTLIADRDNVLHEDANGLIGNGAGRYLYLGNQTSGLKRRSNIHFNVSSIPSGVTVQNVDLRLFCNQSQGAAFGVAVYLGTADWGEGTSDPNGDESNGTTATTNDSTWRHRFYNTVFWTTPGGDFWPTASATTSVGTANLFYTWNSPDLTADVQDWVNAPGTNFGWFLRGDETNSSNTKRFASKQTDTPPNAPQLVVTYLAGVTGACCHADGTCSVTSESTCTSQGGTYQGNGTDCTPNNCPQPTGACCFSNGSCQVLTATDCASQGGAYQGNGTTCTPNLCPQPMGACCFNNGTCQSRTQSDCTAQSGIYQGDGTLCSPELCPVVLTPFVDPLPIPPVAQPVIGNPGGPATYEIAVRQFQQQLHRDLPPTTVWGYGDGPTGGTYPGPTIVTTMNQPITVKWINDLRDEFGNLRTDHYLTVDECPHGAVDQPKVVTHLHGAHVPPVYDGYPENTYLPGNFVTYEYANNQLPGTLWYHDHALGITRLNVYMGLAGGYLITDAFEQSLGLPSGEYELPLVIQDRMFNSDGSWRYPDMWHEHFFGDKMLVNGKVWPYLNVKQGKYRFRVYNGCNSRTLTLALNNGQAFQQIGTEGGMMAAPVALTQLTLGPGERADVIIDFAPHPAGREIVLTNSAPAPYPGTPGEGVIPNVMKFIVVGQSGHTATVPGSLRPFTVLNEGDAVLSRDLVLRKAADPCAGSMWLINELGFHTISEYPVLNTTEIWRFVNRSGVSHPMHMHLVMFQVLDRQDFDMIGGEIVPVGVPLPPPPNEIGWKDTAMVHPNQITRVIAHFDDYLGLYPYHCHILEHEDHEMMRQFRVVECATDPDCDDGVYCNGAEVCNLTTYTCEIGTLPCTDPCEDCVESDGVCEWCSLDLDGSGTMGTGDFAMFADCFGGCYVPADPCSVANFDAGPDGCVSISDFALFANCFGSSCGECLACAGP